ncbi:PAS domain-containing sensor histidine kinase [Maribacter sp. 2307ULW6-5]|uniref:PAS domain-containing sensor histidine kinase n=1 Tax=Maribacter sp. 2307ULW6-5 TaxID=3386275 RepID=UPI0039BD5782
MLFSATESLVPGTWTKTVALGMGAWRPHLLQNKGWGGLALLPYLGLGLLVSLICGLLLWRVTKRHRGSTPSVGKRNRELRESHQRYKTLVNQASDGIFITSSAGVVLEANVMGARMFGYSQKAIKGLHLKDLYDAAHLKENPLKLNQLMRGKSVLKERKLVRKDGSTFYGEVNAKRVGPDTIQGILRDTTERRESKQRLEQQYQELKKTNAVLDQFVYSASHELRAPLSSLLGLLDLVGQEESANARLKPKLKMMESAIKNLDGFIGDIIAYSKNRHLPIGTEPIDFKALTEACIERLWYLEHTKAMDIRLELETKTHFVSDKRRISVLLNNFISNAIKYHRIDQENPWIKIKIVTYADRALIEVSDNGKGIGKAHQDRVFDMFYRGPSDVMGSGIGLFIVKEIVESLQGTLSLKSKKGKGSTFTALLPNRIQKTQER